MFAETVKWVGGIDGLLEMIDQRLLPTQYVILKVRSVEQLHEAIRTLAIRGAPAIGVSAAYGPILALQWLEKPRDAQEAVDHALKACDYLATSRPTAVNLFWALDRMRAKIRLVASRPQATPRQLAEALLAEANAIYAEDVEMCKRIGVNGEKFIRNGFGVLTHCNAGALATAGQGTALSVMFEAQKKGRRFEVYADETRPLLQGSRLTAWELQRAGIPVTVICDNMAGFLMKQGKIQAVITGADRIAANGDTANKIGTYSVSVLAKHHDIPFYIAAPSSTFDMSLSSGDQIPIEQRNASEVTWIGNTHVAPDNVGVYNPAFDVTPAQNIAAIITEKGVIERPDRESVSSHLQTSPRT
ncbi:MAG: S-methyl-5-thioribose-1-phosphate isomerase [Phycisphaerales bacterium]